MSQDARTTFGNRVRELRERRDWSQEQLAQEARTHRNYIGGIERGERNATLDVIARIAAALGVGVTELFRDVPNVGQDRGH